MQSLRTVFAASLISVLAAPVLADTPPAVLASIKPVHSLVAAVMQGVAQPALIVEGAASPHSYALKPSQAEKMAKATHVFWIGHALETFLEKPIETVGANARAVELLDTPGLTTLAFREDGAFDAHEQEEHHEQDEQKADAGDEEHEAHDDHDGHTHDGLDPHIWLDPQNAIALVRGIAAILSEDDTANADTYAANAARTIAALEELTDDVSALLAPLHDRRYVVFHDGYHYFENRFGLQPAGSITISPEITPGAERVREIQHRVRDLGASCVFAEPQFEPRLIAVVLEGSQAKAGTLDPLGADLENGPKLYFELIRNMAASVHDCLS